MLLVSQVMEEGRQAYLAGVDIDQCLYQSPEHSCFEMGYHGAKPIGMVRTDIDFQAVWELGWHIGEKYASVRVGDCKEQVRGG
jgi:hypothetical protein